MQPRTRRVQRVHFPQPLAGRLGRTEVFLVDLSVLGARVEHRAPLGSGGHQQLVFEVDGEQISADCRVVRSRMEKGLYRSGLEFHAVPRQTREAIRQIIDVHLRRSFDEQRRAVHDVILPPLDSMAAIDNGYVCLSLDGSAWFRKRTHDPGQPHEGFTVSADETDAQIELLREAYERSDAAGRRLIQLFAQLSLAEADRDLATAESAVGV